MSPTAEPDPEFEALLDFIRRNRGFDFTAYKPASLTRRVSVRMNIVQIPTIGEYIDYLQAHPDEITSLFNTILINVTSFFRDPGSWAHLAEEILPRIIENKASGEIIRVWSAGCASGEEAFTLAMLLAEQLGAQQFPDRVKIYATDADEEALQTARHATYSTKSLEDVPAELREKYFEPEASGFAFRPDLRRAVIFGRHDLTRDAPISRLDLLVNRNTLMYFNAEAQKSILSRFHFAIGDRGYLFLGRAEMLLTHAEMFRAVDLKHRIFQRVPEAHLPTAPDRSVAPGGRPAADPSTEALLRMLAFDLGQGCQIVVDAAGFVTAANSNARCAFGIRDEDIGRAFRDLEVSYRPLELRSLISACLANGRALRRPSIERHLPDGEVRYFDVTVLPLQQAHQESIGVVVTFEDVTDQHRLREELQRSKEELETTNEELQSTNEELETTNEELQSTNEELETTNEELQSTNEELETMNEELQSTNQELQVLNTELQRQTHSSKRVNLFLESVLASIHTGVVVVDSELVIQAWNEHAVELWGLREEEAVGCPLTDLDIGLPVEELREPILAFFDDTSELRELSLDAVNRRGQKIRCNLTCTIRLGPRRENLGVVMLMEEDV